MTHRQTLRKNQLDKRAQLADSFSPSFSFTALISFLKAHLEPDEYLGLYYAIDSEINVLSLCDYFEKTALPCTIKSPHKDMTFRAWHKNDPLDVGLYQIKQPFSSACEIIPKIVIVPCLGYTQDLHRLGYGGGYYDRYIHKSREQFKNKAPIFVGISYQDLILAEDFLIGSHDQQLDYLFTELGEYHHSTSKSK